MIGGHAGEFVIGIGGELHRFRSQKAGSLVMSVTGMNAAPAVDDHRWPESADDFDHVVQDLVPPDFFRFFRRFGVAEVFSAGEKEFHAITAGRRQQFLGANQPKLWSLFWPEIVLSAFAI